MTLRTTHLPDRVLAHGACLPLLAVLVLAGGCARSTPPGPATPVGQDPPVQTPQTRPISFEQEEPWHSTLDSFQALLGLAKAPTSAQDLSSLTLQLRCSTGTRAPSEPAKALLGPLAELSSVLVYAGDDQEHPLLSCPRSQVAYATATVPGFEYDGRGPVVSLLECVSIPFAAHADLVTAGHPYHLVVLCLDQAGRTMASEEISGDQAVTELEAPPGGWTSFLLPPWRGEQSPPPGLAGRPHADVGVASMEMDGTMRLLLRSEEGDGTIAEALLIITNADPRYPAMAAHLGHPRPGTSCAIPPFRVDDGTAAPASPPTH